MVPILQLTEKIKAEAYNLGFSLFGVTLPESPPHIEVYKKWILDLQNADMLYLARESAIRRRENPASNLTGCKSIIILGFSYAGPFNLSQPKDTLPRGKVAAYAWGHDYHQIAAERANQLVDHIKTLSPSSSARIYVDTGPILERDLAQMAGLGWIGKNTCLISPKEGSYFFLVEIFTDVLLEPTPSFLQDRCGTCQKCINICPTKCILPNRTINAAACISYLTIENKGPIPVNLRPAIGNWVFGCDLCQTVCPWNIKHNSRSGDPFLAPTLDQAFPNLFAELYLTPEQFKSKFSTSPISRTRRRGYLRNVAIALGNQAAPDHFPNILNALNLEEDPLIRRHLYWALMQTGSKHIRKTLKYSLEQEKDPDSLGEIKQYLNESP